MKKKKNNYKCLHCGSTKMYISKWPSLPETLTCINCGETEDAAKGISVNGVKINHSPRGVRHSPRVYGE